MRIKDKIANDIMTKLEVGMMLKISKAKYLDVECLIADTIEKGLLKWLRYDADLNEFMEE